MAAATTLVDIGAAKLRGFREERVRNPVGGASFGLSKEKSAEKRREEGRLDEGERAELLFLWGGYDTALGCKSVHGAVQDRLMRYSPPDEGRGLEDAIANVLREHGKLGAPREKVMLLVMAEEQSPKDPGRGATRYEVVRALRAMVGRGDVEFFVEERTRDCQRLRFRDHVDMLTGPERRDVPQQKGKAETEMVLVEMVRLSPTRARKFPDAVAPAERWRRMDEELERDCRTIHVSETRNGSGSGLPPTAPAGRAEAARTALRRMDAEHRKVLERAYATSSVSPMLSPWAGKGLEIARLVPMTKAAEAARRELVASKGPASDRSTFVADALRAKLDAAPDEELARARWRAAREAFVERAGREAEAMLGAAVKAYRQARERM